MAIITKFLLLVFRLPTLVLLGPIVAAIGWLIHKGGGRDNFAKSILHNIATNIVMACGVGACGLLFADPVMERLNQLRGGQIRMEEKIDRILAQMEAQSGVTPDAQTEASIADTIKSLLSAGEGARQRAGEKLADNDTAGARLELEQLAAQQEDAIIDAAQTWRDIGNLAFLNETQEALDAFERVTQLTPNDAYGWNQLGILYDRVGKLDDAEAAYKKVLDLGKARADKGLIAIGFGNLGLVEGKRGNLDRAVAYYEKALALDKELGSKQGMASNYGNLGVVEYTRGNLDAAVGYYEKALALNKELGSKEGMANQYGNLGSVEQTRGNLDAAVNYYQQALALNKELGSREGIASNYGNLGVMEQTRGNLDAAVDYYEQALALNKELGRKQGMAYNYGNLGVMEQTRGNLDAAVDYYQQSLAIEKELGRKQGMANNYANLGVVEYTRGNLNAACTYWRDAYDLFAQSGAAPMVARVGGWMRKNGCPGAPQE